MKEKEKETNFEYIKQRRKIICYIKKLVENFDYSEETFHSTSLYVDTILRKNISEVEFKYDLVVIGCLILAGIKIIY